MDPNKIIEKIKTQIQRDKELGANITLEETTEFIKIYTTNQDHSLHWYKNILLCNFNIFNIESNVINKHFEGQHKYEENLIIYKTNIKGMY